MQRILVLRGGALGDFIVTLPTLAALRAQWPGARIELAGNAAAAALAQARGLLDQVHSQHEARWGALFGPARLPEAFGAWLGEFDLILNYWPDPEGELGRRFPLRRGQRFLSAPAMPASAPAALHYAQPLRALGLMRTDPLFALAQPAPEKRLVAIHPGSGSPRKNWLRARWVELAQWLIEAHAAELLIVSGEADDPGPLASLGRSARHLPLESLAAELARCRLFLGHDSGVSHLAAACGAPSVLLFGPTDPQMWAPPAPFVSVLRRGAELDAISLADVQEAVSRALAAPA